MIIHAGLKGLAVALTLLTWPATNLPHHVQNIARSGSTTTTAVSATLRDSSTDHIRSDDGTPYIDGVDKVRAVLDSVGDFDLDTNTSTAPAIRLLLLDFTACVTLNDCYPPLQAGFVDAYVSTGGGGLLKMAVGSSQAATLQVFFADPGGNPIQWFLRFNPTSHPGTSTVTVTRTTTDTWVIAADASCIAKLLSAPTRGKLVLTDQGNFFMPFSIAVRLK